MHALWGIGWTHLYCGSIVFERGYEIFGRTFYSLFIAVDLLLGPNTSNLIRISCEYSCYQQLVAITTWLMDGTPLGHSNQTTATVATTSSSHCSSGEESATEMLHVRATPLPYSFTVQCIVVHLCVPENSTDDSCRPRAYYSQQIQAYIELGIKKIVKLKTIFHF